MISEIKTYVDNVGAMLGEYLPTLLAAILVLIVGWLLAWVVSVLAHKALMRASLDNQIAALVTERETKRPN